MNSSINSNTCKDCDKRTATCHADCRLYRMYSEYRKIRKANIQKQIILESEINDSVKRGIERSIKRRNR